MKPIGYLIKMQNKEERSLCVKPQKQPLIPQKRITQIIESIGSSEDFLIKLTPEEQNVAAKHKELAYTSVKAPTLIEVCIVYGRDIAVSWLSIQLNNLNEYCGVKNKMPVEVSNDLADKIIIKYHYLKVSEILLFFFEFKTGEYGVLYGSVDPLVITNALREFVARRFDVLNRIEREHKRNKPYTASLNAMSREEHLKLKENAKKDINSFVKLFQNLPKDKTAQEYWNEWKDNPDEIGRKLVNYNLNLNRNG